MNAQILVDNFHFLRPQWLWLAFPFVGLLYLNWRAQTKKSQWLKHVPKHLFNALRVGQSPWKNYLPIKLLAVIGIAAIVISSGPSWYRQPSPLGENKSPLVIVLDVSESMLQRDIAPSRLFHAQQKILQLLEKRNSGTTALIVYSGSSHLAMPLTQDIEVFKPLLDAIQPSIMPRSGKFAEYTLPTIEQALLAEAATVLLITDALSERAFTNYQKYFNEKPHHLLIYGIGAQNVPTPFPLESEQLENLASSVNGEFVFFTADERDIEQLTNEVAAFAELSGGVSEPWFDGGYPLIWLVLTLYLLWFRKGWLVQWSIGILVVNASLFSPMASAAELTFLDLWLSKDQQAFMKYQDGEYLLAAELFESDHWKATAYYQAGEYEIAQQYYMRSDDIDSQLSAAAALAHQKEYIAAQYLYREILKADPDNVIAQHNEKIVTNIIKHIDNFTESQSNSNEQQSSRERGDKPKSSEGVIQEVERLLLIQEVFTAEQILNSSEANNKWMKRVESNLSTFLATKFSLQLELGSGTTTEWDDE